MEIEFNPSHAPKAELVHSANRQVTTTATTDSTSLSSSGPMTAPIQDKLNSIPLVRQNMVDRASALASDSQFPPDFYEERIAVLLALHIKP